MGRAKHLGHRVIAIMDRVGVAPLVRNYHLFYTCVANSDPAIRKAVRDLGRFPSQKEIDRVIDQFCPEANDSYTMRTHQNTFLGTLDEFVQRLKKEGVELSSFNDVIGRVTNSLAQPAGGGRLTQDVLSKIAEILSEAGNRRVVATESLLRQLQENRNEVDALRSELIELRKIANTDSLTGLANRRAFDDKLSQLMGQKTHFVLLLADLDHFKQINDEHGHAFGDQVLKAAAQVLRKSMGDDIFLARTGGEEFAAIVPDASPDQAFRIAERLRLSMQANHVRKNKEDVAVTISVGLAQSRLFAASNDVYEAADMALYQSKHAGRNRVSGHVSANEITSDNRYRLYSGTDR